MATPGQLRVVDKLVDPREMELPDAAYEGTRLADDPRYGKPCGNTQLAKTVAVYDRADPAAARVVIMAGSDFEGTSPKLFWPETLIYSLPGAELNQMLTLVVAIKSEMPCEPELLLFAGMNDHLHATGFLEQLKGDEPAPKKIWQAIQRLFAAMNEVQKNVASRFGPKTKVAFTTSPGYASMPPALQFVYAILILIAEGNGWRILMAAPNDFEMEPTNLRLRRSELAAAWADVSHALRGFYELADILIVLDEVLLLEISNFARQLKLSPIIGDDHPVVTHLTASLWFRSMELTITSYTSKSRGPSNESKNVAAAEKQLESMVYRLTQERGRWPFLTPRLENATEKTREGTPPLVKQIWDFLEEHLEVAEKREMTVGRFVTAANEVTIGGFWREHARGELRTRRDHEILEFLSPCWGKEFMARSVASNPKTHQELEGWTRSGDGVSHERSLWFASKCEVPSRVSDGQPMWQPLSITHGDGRSVQPEGIDRQSLLSTQVCKMARMSHHSHKLLRKIRGTVPKDQRDDLSEIWGEELLGLESENTSDHERQNVIGKPMVGAPNLEEIDVIHEKMMELEPLLEASGERNLRSIDLTHGDCPCHCLAQTVWYPDHANLCLIWDVEEIRSLGLPDHQQKVTILAVSTMLALRWMEENIAKYRESKTPTAESIHAIDYSRRLELFETACKVFAIPMEVRHMWSRLRFFPWFRATLTS